MVEPATAPRLNSFYIFKFSNQQSMADSQPRWTEIEHLPEWDEEFYHIYTAKKFGKWVMIKTLKPEFRDMPEYRAIDREGVRHSL